MQHQFLNQVDRFRWTIVWLFLLSIQSFSRPGPHSSPIFVIIFHETTPKLSLSGLFVGTSIRNISCRSCRWFCARVIIVIAIGGLFSGIDVLGPAMNVGGMWILIAEVSLANWMFLETIYFIFGRSRVIVPMDRAPPKFFSELLGISFILIFQSFKVVTLSLQGL